MIFTVLLGLFGCSNDAGDRITSVESMTLTLRGMRGGTVYKLETGSEPTKLCRYREIYSDEDDRLELEKSIICTQDTIVGLMNNCRVSAWDGFSGDHPRNVSDGIMFCFEAEINGGRVISADGSANFPKGYADFVRAIDEMLASGEVWGNSET